MRRALILLSCAALLALASCRDNGGAADTRTDDGTGLGADFEQGRLAFTTDDGQRIDFDVYIARDIEQQRRGLMFVREMPQSTGMLFVYDRPAIRSIWMKNTYIPLDLVFIRADGQVSSVVANAVPLTEASRSSKEPVKYIVELNGGVAARFGIDARSRMVWDDTGDAK